MSKFPPCRFSDLVDGSAESEDSLRAFLRELSNIELTEQKMRAVIMAQKREQLGYEKKQETLFQQIEQAKADIEAKKIELVEARVVRAYMESYEGPRGEICQIPSRESTLNEQQRVLRQMAEAETEGCKYTALIERKKKAISQLFQSLSNLQKPDEEPSEQELELARALNESEIEPDAAAMELEAGEMVDE